MSLKALIVSSLIVLLTRLRVCEGIGNGCGKVQLLIPNVLKGAGTVRGAWPFLAALYHVEDSKFFCGATLISSKNVLTAAHCVQQKGSMMKLKPSDVIVLLGAYNLNQKVERGTEQREVEETYLHPDWRAFNEKYDADLAILVLSEIVEFTRYIRPICLPGDDPPIDAKASIVGWGLSEKSIANMLEHETIPHQASTRILNDSYCYTNQDFLALFSTTRVFCGGGDGGTPSQGDSGGGLFVLSGSSWTQYGIISASLADPSGSVLPDSFSLYTNVRAFKSWIDQTVVKSGNIIINRNKNICSCATLNVNVTSQNSEDDLVTGTHLPEPNADKIISTMSIGQYGNWEQFWTLSTFDFYIQGTLESETSKIYANSRNMVEVVITVEILDDSGNGFNVTDDEIKNQLYFCHSETGEDLAPIWMISNERNEYVSSGGNGDGSFSAQLSNDRRYIRKYISCDTHEFDRIAEKISVGINVPGFGKFDTSRYGTSTKMGSGGIFKSPKAYQIIALRPIDYGLKENVIIESSEFETIYQTFNWVSRYGTEGPYKNYPDGKCKRRIVYIRPNRTVTGQQKFKKHEILYDPIYNSDISKGTVWWSNDNTREDCFSLINKDYARPGAVIGRGKDEHGVEKNDYEVNLWYSRQNHVRIDGKFYVVGRDYYYQFNDDGQAIEENHFGVDENGAASLLLYKFVIPNAQGLWDWNSQNCVRNITVYVTDFYGNDGLLQLLFNDSDSFDEPGLK